VFGSSDYKLRQTRDVNITGFGLGRWSVGNLVMASALIHKPAVKLEGTKQVSLHGNLSRTHVQRHMDLLHRAAVKEGAVAVKNTATPLTTGTRSGYVRSGNVKLQSYLPW
jgi:hypothetical protein